MKAALSSHEEIGLRRIAQGSSVDRRLAAKLQGLALIQLTNKGSRLTPLGQLRYDGLSKPPLLARPRSSHAVNGYVEGLLDKARSHVRTGAG